MKVSSRSIMEVPSYKIRALSGWKSQSIRKDEIDSRIFYIWDLWHETERGKKRKALMDTRALKAHRADATEMEREWNMQAESHRRGETSGCFEKVHTLFALCTRHLFPSLFFSLLIRRHFSPYLQWRLRPGCCTISLTRGVLLDYDRKMLKSSTRHISISFFLFCLTASRRHQFSDLFRIEILYSISLCLSHWFFSAHMLLITAN